MKTFDAQAGFGFVVAQAAHIEKQVNKAVYPDIQYSALIPVDTSAHPMTQSVIYYSSDAFGKANWVNGNAADIPKVGTERNMFKTSVYTAGIGYGYGWEEVQNAMLYGINLSADLAMAARRASEEMIDEVALRGDTGKNFLGLFNYSGITTAAAATGNWPAVTLADADLILADVNLALMGIATDTLQTSMADTLLMSAERLQLIASRRLPNTTMTIMEFLRINNIYTLSTGQPLTIRAALGLGTAGAGGVQRMVAYRRSPDVLKLHIPMPHRFFPVWQSGPMSWEVPGLFRLGGLYIRRPKEVRYIDGI